MPRINPSYIEPDDKYAIFKAPDFLRWFESLPATIRQAAPTIVTDAEVIRHQDRLAAPVLYTYYSAIDNTVEIMQELGVDVPKYLYEVRDHFFSAAENAHNYPVKKLPDA